MKIFIYGGTGYIGTSLICGLGERHQFFIATRKKTKNFIYNAQLFDENKDSKIIKKKLKQADLIIFANGPSYKDSLKNLYKYVRYLNIQIENIIKLKKKKTKIIYFSTIHVYENYNLNKAKTSDLLNSKSHYAIRNIVCENLILNKLNFNNVNIIRLSNIFGIQSNIIKLESKLFRLAINQFCYNIIKKKEIVINSNSSEKRNFVSINDLVKFIKKNFVDKQYKFKPIINYASKKNISLKFLIKTIKLQSNLLNIKIPKIYLKNKIKNSKINYNFDISDIKINNFHPKISLKKEIYNTLKKINNLM